MSFRTKYILWALSATLFLQVCENGGSLINPSPMENMRYYESEIFPNHLKDIYGIWELKAVSGGMPGEGAAPDFDYIEIQEIGIFKIYRNDTLLTFGRINLAEVTEDGAASIILENEPDDSPELIQDRKKLIDLRSDTLNLFAHCCNGFNYHLIRSKKR